MVTGSSTGADVGTTSGTGTDSAARATTYRSDLDGLRGVAIALVVVFHIWFGRVSGGVDVFLVLSGFFFTGLLVRRAETGSVGIGFTLRRTGRRLLPAMVVVLAAVVAATAYTRPYTQWGDLAGQTLASMFYYQNWRLALTWSDYLAADPSVSPLQHLWSMAVQGQFYLLALVVVAAVTAVLRRTGRIARIRPVLAVVIAPAAVLSLLYAAHGAATHQGWNYYDSGARLWELLAGAALALAGPMLMLPRILRAVTAFAGVAVVVGCGWLIVDGANRYPGPAALVPVLAALAVIASANNVAPGERPWPNRLLASPVAQWLGNIAYPLYLWHWPILIFFLAESGHSRAGLTGGAGVVALSLALAWGTHRWVEQPLRMGARTAAARSVRYRRFAGAAVSIVAVVVVATTTVWQFGVVRTQPAPAAQALDPVKYPGAEALAAHAPVPSAPMRPTVLQAPNELPPPTLDGCIADWNTRDVVTCTYGDASATRTIAVVGSSHAEHWVPAFQELAAEHSFRIQVYLKMGCPLTLADDATYNGEPIPDCRDWSRDVVDRLAVDRPDWVFTTGSRPRAGAGDETPQYYVDVWSALAQRGLNVVTIRDTPWSRRGEVPYKAADCLAGGGNAVSCGMRRADALDPVDPQLEPASRYPNIFPIDLSDAFCDAQVCPVVVGNILVYHDEHHLTSSYSRSLAGALGRALDPLLHWW
ncbi:putative acyltransferase [Nocardia nova SH22a]|uniref:Putative acyltransferase n=1 Tax=Nocardia nova SH22a TaxID=1415166 RepID=W5TJN9_9NOCA|nr:acyltransferase family protein [Nocardia nova]AHH19427.1 putative acyltransferase [Nocardia nova SH22a]